MHAQLSGPWPAGSSDLFASPGGLPVSDPWELLGNLTGNLLINARDVLRILIGWLELGDLFVFLVSVYVALTLLTKGGRFSGPLSLFVTFLTTATHGVVLYIMVPRNIPGWYQSDRHMMSVLFGWLLVESRLIWLFLSPAEPAASTQPSEGRGYLWHAYIFLRRLRFRFTSFLLGTLLCVTQINGMLAAQESVLHFTYIKGTVDPFRTPPEAVPPSLTVLVLFGLLGSFASLTALTVLWGLRMMDDPPITRSLLRGRFQLVLITTTILAFNYRYPGMVCSVTRSVLWFASAFGVNTALLGTWMQAVFDRIVGWASFLIPSLGPQSVYMIMLHGAGAHFIHTALIINFLVFAVLGNIIDTHACSPIDGFIRLVIWAIRRRAIRL